MTGTDEIEETFASSAATFSSKDAFTSSTAATAATFASSILATCEASIASSFSVILSSMIIP